MINQIYTLCLFVMYIFNLKSQLWHDVTTEAVVSSVLEIFSLIYSM